MTMVTQDHELSRPTRVAFVDTGNTGRSVMSEALANAMIREKGLNIQVISRAVDINPYNVVPEANAAALLLLRGIDVSAHRAQALTAADVKYSDLILAATAQHCSTIIDGFPDAAGKTQTMAEFATGTHADIDDALGQDMPFYERVLGQIAGYLPAVVEKVR